MEIFRKMADPAMGASADTFNMSTASKQLNSDSTSLVDLKAEVSRKRNEALQNKAHGRHKANVSSAQKTTNIWSKSNIGVIKRSVEAAEQERKERMKVQASLEQKAAIYDQLKKGQYVDKDSVFLVDFEDATHEAKNEDEEWVEYVDALGRTRTCMKSELTEMKSRDLETFGETGQVEAEQSLLSEDMRREMLRQKWEEEEEENLKKPNLHYKDILYDEARTHGAAFYNFSRNEAERIEQMDNLEMLHQETLDSRTKKEASKAKREAMLAARLKKVRDRKRLKMGLPVKPDEELPPHSDVLRTDNEKKELSIEDSVMENLRTLRQVEEDKLRKNIVREWDVGKEGVSGQATNQEEFKEKLKINMERKVLNQQEWVDKKRKERVNEFAPPINYDKKGAGGGARAASSQKQQKKSYASVAPPKNFETDYQASTSKVTNSFSSPSIPTVQNDPISQNIQYEGGFNPYASSCSKTKKMSLQARLSLHEEFNERDEISNQNTGGVAIPPPMEMNYFNSGQNVKKGPKKSGRNHDQMAEAFLQGLNSLKKRPHSPEEETDSD